MFTEVSPPAGGTTLDAVTMELNALKGPTLAAVGQLNAGISGLEIVLSSVDLTNTCVILSAATNVLTLRLSSSITSIFTQISPSN